MLQFWKKDELMAGHWGAALSLHPMQYYCGAIMNSVVKGCNEDIAVYIYLFWFVVKSRALGVRCLLCMVWLEKIGLSFNSFTFWDAKKQGCTIWGIMWFFCNDIEVFY